MPISEMAVKDSRKETSCHNQTRGEQIGKLRNSQARESSHIMDIGTSHPYEMFPLFQMEVSL